VITVLLSMGLVIVMATTRQFSTARVPKTSASDFSATAGSDADPDTIQLRTRLSPRRRRVAKGAKVAAVLLVAVTIDLILGVGVALAITSLPKFRRVIAARRARHQIESALPDAIEMLILIVHAGLTPHQAIAVLCDRAPPPTRFAFVEVTQRIERGAVLADALQVLPDLLGVQAFGLADTLAVAERNGTPIGRTLEQLSSDVRERRRRKAEANARTLPVKLSFPLVMCTLPSFVLIAIVPAVLAALRSLGGAPL
jgi:tight adherence protein C